MAYGQRIRSFDREPESLLSHEMLRMIKSRTTAIELTPHLRRLDLNIHGMADLVLCSILVNVSLTSLSLDFGNCGRKLDVGVLHSIFSKTPRLRKLHLDGDFVEALRQSTSKLTLEKFSFSLCHHPDHLPSVVRNLGLVLPVTCLHADVPSAAAAWTTAAGFKEGLFASLWSLKISASFASVLKCFPGVPSLTELAISSYCSEDASTVDQLLRSASEDLLSLGALCINGALFANWNSLTFAMLTRQKVIRRLTNFSLSWPTALRGSNDHLISLLRHMPEVETLRLTPWSHNAGESGLTLDVLPAFARHCPRLRDLELFIDCRILPSTDSLEDGHTRRSALRNLNLSGSPFNFDVSKDRTPWLNSLLPKSCGLRYNSLVEAEFKRLRVASD